MLFKPSYNSYLSHEINLSSWNQYFNINGKFNYINIQVPMCTLGHNVKQFYCCMYVFTMVAVKKIENQ